MELKNSTIADLHIHSRFSRACSKNIDFENLAKWAKIKGLNLLGTGDFTHPIWIEEIKKLKPNEKGFYYYEDFPFIITGEISLIYTQGRGRRVHLVLLVPNIKIAEKINSYFDTKGRRDYDGRPIFKISCEEFTKEMKNISQEIEIIPAHIWTPYFGVLGSMSGFDSLKEAFGEQEKNIFAIETGISSDPKMNLQITELKNKSIVSFSDAHCIHPDTLITLKDGYVLPISEIKNEIILTCADFNKKQSKEISKLQFSKIISPKNLKKIKYFGGEICVSEKHRFFIYEKEKVIEKYAFELKKGDKLFRIAKLSHNIKKFRFKKPQINSYYSLNKEGINFIKNRRKEKKLLQKDIAKKLKIYKDHYWKIENGLVKINQIFLKKISKLLDFNFNNFLEKYTDKYFDFKFPNKNSIKLFELLGYLMGDGCFAIRNRGACLLFADKNKEILKYYKKIIESLFSCKCRISKYFSQNSYELFAPAHVAQFFKINFPNAILKAKDLRIPREIFSASLKEIAGFLRGFFDAEGCFGHHNVDVCSSNKLLLFQIDSLLKKFGIFTTVSLNQLEKTKQKYRHRLYLYGENLRKFEKEINFNHPLKKSKLQNYIKKLKILRKSKIKKFGDFILTEIQSIRNIKSNTKYLYDIAIPKYKNYIANQVIVHNSFWPWRLGREATIFKKTESYSELIKQIRENSFIGTIEVDPAYGKYHWDGHSNCNFSCSPEKTKQLNNLCPKCGKKLIIGVENRVEELSNSTETNGKIFYTILPLHEIISLQINANMQTKKVWAIYNKLIKKFENEFNILLNISEKELIENKVDEKLIKLIIKNREGKIKVKPGYDGEYGIAQLETQETLF
ncbi:MAG: LAGLIDADG family homing endonuclease [Nanoarchaeota archaeon]